MQIKDIQTGELFYIKGDIVHPKLKIEDGYVDLRVRHQESGNEDLECTPLTIELLCVVMHREEIMEWVNNAKAFFIPEPEIKVE